MLIWFCLVRSGFCREFKANLERFELLFSVASNDWSRRTRSPATGSTDNRGHPFPSTKKESSRVIWKCTGHCSSVSCHMIISLPQYHWKEGGRKKPGINEHLLLLTRFPSTCSHALPVPIGTSCYSVFATGCSSWNLIWEVEICWGVIARASICAQSEHMLIRDISKTWCKLPVTLFRGDKTMGGVGGDPFASQSFCTARRTGRHGSNRIQTCLQFISIFGKQWEKLWLIQLELLCVAKVSESCYLEMH